MDTDLQNYLSRRFLFCFLPNVPCEQIIFKHKFYLSNEKLYYRFNLYSVVDFLSRLGGIACTFLSVFRIIGTQVNDNAIEDKHIRNLYFVKEKEIEDKNSMRRSSS